jgi:Fur family ferric uptake transcriptional regulator
MRASVVGACVDQCPINQDAHAAGDSQRDTRIRWMTAIHSTVRGEGDSSSAGKTDGVALARRLSLAGLRVTANRMAVLATLDNARRLLSHSDIDAQMATPIDRVTLYRTLESCVDAGLVRKEVGYDRISRFALNVGDQHDHRAHAHFQCQGCGRTYCLPAKVPRRLQVPDGFTVTAVDVQAHGECANCQAAHRQ